jgi:hypothetical protein
MSELRHFLRYEITGLMFFVHINAFLYGIGKICSREQLLKLIVPEAVISVLVGWIIYQIYDTLNSSAHCMKSSIDEVKKWAENGINDTDAKHAIQIGLYNNIKQTKETKDSDFNMKELLNLLSSKFDHWGSRIINTSINAICLSIYLILIFLNCCKLVKVNIYFFYIISSVTGVILESVGNPPKNITESLTKQ